MAEKNPLKLYRVDFHGTELVFQLSEAEAERLNANPYLNDEELEEVPKDSEEDPTKDSKDTPKKAPTATKK